MENHKIIVIGGGAAGFFAAINCAQLTNNTGVFNPRKNLINYFPKFVFREVVDVM